jgi:hypothetical protein
MQIESAARRFFLSDNTVNGLVAGKVFKWILKEQLDGTGGQALVVSRQPGWATPDPVKTSHFPVLRVRSYADQTRTPQGEIEALDAADKAYALADVVDKLIHGKRGVVWGGDQGCLIVACSRWQEGTLTTQNDQHAAVDTSLGDVVYVETSYAVEWA